MLGCQTMGEAWPRERTRDAIVRAAADLAALLAGNDTWEVS